MRHFHAVVVLVEACLLVHLGLLRSEVPGAWLRCAHYCIVADQHKTHKIHVAPWLVKTSTRQGHTSNPPSFAPPPPSPQFHVVTPGDIHTPNVNGTLPYSARARLLVQYVRPPRPHGAVRRGGRRAGPRRKHAGGRAAAGAPIVRILYIAYLVMGLGAGGARSKSRFLGTVRSVFSSGVPPRVRWVCCEHTGFVNCLGVFSAGEFGGCLSLVHHTEYGKQHGGLPTGSSTR